ncbi:MAG: ABC transporter ATP-binding protein [Deltaproteobacteria bacterium]|jgi:oligopeptide/dipeptide ABC transporter ATP-binding protein|nr:ABC transporter ATP-binding protein [Deltaproteobacteria bacterium]
MTAAAEKPLLRVEDLAVAFAAEGRDALAVDGVSFTLDRGETLCLVGESGCGKSATALSILRLIPSPPGRIARGAVFFADRNLTAMPEKELERIRGDRIGMVFQEPMTALNPVFRIGGQIAEPLRVHRGMSQKEALERAAELLHEVGIPDAGGRLRDFPHQLSGGMRQRVMVAMAVACEPDIVIADEPTTALDVTVQSQVLRLLTRLTKGRGKGLLLITHDLGVVRGTADRVAVMYAGKIVETAGAEELFARPGHPYTRGLMLSRPRLDPSARHERLPSIPGVVPNPLARPTGCLFRDRCALAEGRCAQEPPLAAIAPGHFCRCWLK